MTAQSQRPANGADDNQYNHCPVCDGVDSQHIFRPDMSLHPRQTFSLMHVISFKNAIKILVNGPLFTFCASYSFSTFWPVSDDATHLPR